MVLGVVAAVVVAAGVLYQLAGVRASARRYPPPGELIDADGQRLHLVCEGDGRPAVVFESGIAASSLSWSRVLQGVAAFTRACAYDRAGLGWSAAVHSPRSVSRMLHELGFVAAHVAGATPIVLVGHSFGALLACAYAAERPDQIAGLALLDPPSEWEAMTREQRRLLRGGVRLSHLGGVLARLGIVRASLALLTGGAPGASRAIARVFGPTAARMLERLVGEVRKLPEDVHPVVQAIWCQPKCFGAMAAHLAALPDTADAVRRISSLPPVPLVVVSSGDQPPDVLDRHRALACLSSQGRHVVAPTSGHWIQFDDPDLVVSTVREVVDLHLRQAVGPRPL
jgi:pimeloyl-ACP methyl ester carboxylesterase